MIELPPGITAVYRLDLMLKVACDDSRDESVVIDKVCEFALRKADELGLHNDTVFNSGGPAHHPYVSVVTDNLNAVCRLYVLLHWYANKFKAVTWEAL